MAMKTTIWRPNVRGRSTSMGKSRTGAGGEGGAKKGRAEKAPPEGPCEHGVKYGRTQGVQRLSARASALCMQGVRQGINLRARSYALSVQGVQWGAQSARQSSALYVQGVRWGINLRARGRMRSQCKGAVEEICGTVAPLSVQEVRRV